MVLLSQDKVRGRRAERSGARRSRAEVLNVRKLMFVTYTTYVHTEE